MPMPCSTPTLAALLMLTSACGDSLEPGTLGQTYSLVTVANEPLPTTLHVTESGTIRVISQLIRFGPKGSGSLAETTEMVPLDPQAPSEGPLQLDIGIQWTEVDGRIEIEFNCPPDANCAAGPHLIARVDGHDLRAAWGPHMIGRAPLRYEEVISSQ
ncbi:MAG: hypothetical protein K0S19_2006 [Geminicoccaceae bacterium]|nr:hypothetical protein [Geminicoccaceae bacterium]